MQPRARRVSQGNQRIRGQWRPSFSLSLSLFMQYFGHGMDRMTDDVGDVGDLIIWFPLHGRPDSRGEAQWAPTDGRTERGGDIFLPMHLCDSETGAVDVFRH